MSDWVLCSERLPEEEREYLIYSPQWGRDVALFQVKGTYRGFDWNGGCVVDPIDVTTHWTELPEEPK